MASGAWTSENLPRHHDNPDPRPVATPTTFQGEPVKQEETGATGVPHGLVVNPVGHECLTPEEVVEKVVEKMTEEQMRELEEALEGELVAKADAQSTNIDIEPLITDEGGDEIDLSLTDGPTWIKEVLGGDEALLVAPSVVGQNELFVRPEDKYKVNELKLKMQRGEHPGFISTTADKKLLAKEHDYCTEGRLERREMKVTEVKRVLRSSTRPVQLTHIGGETIDMVNLGGEEEDVDVESYIPDDQLKEVSPAEVALLAQKSQTRDEVDEQGKRQSVRIAKRNNQLVDLDDSHGEDGEKDRTDDEEGEEEEEEEDEEEEDDGDDRLYCVCKEKHDDRFMICCDRCNEWFHGDCVGITVEAGMEMDANEEDYVCPICLGKNFETFKSKSEQTNEKQSTKTTESDTKAAEKNTETIEKNTETTEKPFRKGKTLRQRDDTVQDTVQSELINERALNRLRLRLDDARITLSSYNEDQDWVPQEGDGEIEKEGSNREKKDAHSIAKKLIPKGERCAASGCKKRAVPGTAYCSDECVARYAQEALNDLDRLTEAETQSKKKPTFLQPTGRNELPASASSSRGDSSRSAVGRIPVVDRSSGRVVAGVAAPRREKLATWLVDHPTYEVLMRPLPTVKGGIPSAPLSPVKTPSKEEKQLHSDPERRSSSSSKKRGDRSPTRAPAMDVKLVRNNVARSLKEILWQRCQESQEFSMNEKEVQRLGKKIERELYALHEGTGQKYKAKYRTLMFNLKDQRNRVLYKNVLSGTLKPFNLVRLSSDELASQELAKWRKEENKKAIELIKAIEIQEAARKTSVTKMTHKGEIEISEVKEVPETTSFLDMLAVDTTDQHQNHVFSVSCRICSGKAPPQEQQQEPLKDAQAIKKEEVNKESQRPREERKTDKKQSRPTARSKKEKPVKVASGVEKVTDKSDDKSASATKKTNSDDVVMEDTSQKGAESLHPATDKLPENLPLVVPSPGWKGFVSFPSIAKFLATAYPVSGPLESDMLSNVLPDICHVQGRIAHDQVWDYIQQLKLSGTKDICLIRLEAASGDEQASYRDLYKYMTEKDRYVVVGALNMIQVKDMYLLPLPANGSLPSSLLPIKGRGLPEKQTDMIIGVVIKHRGKSKRHHGKSALPTEPPAKRSAEDRPHGMKRHSKSDAPINLAKKGLFHYKGAMGTPTVPVRKSPEKYSPLQSVGDEETKPSVAVSSILSLALAKAEKAEASPCPPTESSSGIPLLGDQIPLLGEPGPSTEAQNPAQPATFANPSPVSSSLLQAVKSMSHDTLQNIAHVVGLMKQGPQDAKSYPSPSHQSPFIPLQHSINSRDDRPTPSGWTPPKQPRGTGTSPLVSANDSTTHARKDGTSRWNNSQPREDGSKQSEPGTGGRRENQKSRMPKELKEYIEATRRELQESAEQMEKSLEMKGIPLGYQSAVKALEERQKQEEKQRVEEGKTQTDKEHPFNRPEGEGKEAAMDTVARERELREREAAGREEQKTLELREHEQSRDEGSVQPFHREEPWAGVRDPRFAGYPAVSRHDDPWRYPDDREQQIQRRPLETRWGEDPRETRWRDEVQEARWRDNPRETRWGDDPRYPEHPGYYDRGRAHEYDQRRPLYHDPVDHRERDHPSFRGAPPPRHARYDDYDSRYDGRPPYQ